MSYEVLARKWRPKQFAEVVGQEHVTRTLENAILSDRVVHAYLFVGPRGTGKTSIARIFAKSLNCEKGPTPKPCDACPACKEIAAGANLDVQEIDGASNRGIDEIRSLRDNVKYVSAGRHRIYIIDEVHMLTTEAFNALLKTLEEPPPHVKFLFATTEPHKVPLTILSRCQRFDLRRIPIKLMTERLAVIAKAEQVQADNNVLAALARASEGSLRDAESSLDQLISFKGKSIGESDVISAFGLVSRQGMEELTSAVLNGDIPALIRLVNEFDGQGKDMQRLLVELLEHFLNLLALEQGGSDSLESDLDSITIELMKKQAENVNVDRLLKIMEVLVETMDRLRYALSKKTLLETALIRCARTSTIVSLDNIVSQIRELKAGLANITNGEADSEQKPKHEPSHAAPELLSKQEDGQPRDKQPCSDEEEISLLKKNWRSIIEHTGRVATLAKNALLDAKPVSVAENVVTIGFDREFPDRIAHMQVARNRNILCKELSRLLGRQVTVECILIDIPGGSNEENTTPADKADRPAKKGGEGKTGSIKKWMSDEAVRKTIDMFNGSITDVKE